MEEIGTYSQIEFHDLQGLMPLLEYGTLTSNYHDYRIATTYVAQLADCLTRRRELEEFLSEGVGVEEPLDWKPPKVNFMVMHLHKREAA